jgi:ATP-binding cassette subfamily B protein
MSRFAKYSIRYALPEWPYFLAGIVALAAVNLVTLEIPQLAKRIINGLTSANLAGGGIDPAQISDAESTALKIIGLGALMIIIRGLSRILIFWPGRRLEAATKTDLFARILRVPEAFFLKHGLGDLISRLANDVGQIRVFYAFGLLQILNLGFLLVFTISKMISVHATLTALCLTPMIAMLAITKYTLPRMHRYSRENQDAIGTLTTKVTEAFVNVHVIQANAAVQSFVDRSEKENRRVYDTNIKLVAIRTVVFPLMTCLAGISQLIVLFYGGQQVIAGNLTVGDILAFNVYIGLLAFPLTALGIIFAVYQRAKTALDRIGEVQDAPLESSLVKTQKTIFEKSPPLLEIKNLHFSYEGNDSFKLQGIDFRLPAGKHLGLFGPIGSGKSTILNLITRLFDPPAQTIFWHGEDILTVSPTELRRQSGYALQTVHLFSDSIRNNLAFGMTSSPSQAALEEAAREAQILAEINGFEHGWDTEIGEKGVRLSGGQKQRLALARIFLRRPPLLLLDDVLSAVDHKTEQALLKEIYGLGSALIMTSHRGSALRQCDEILILDQGKIIDRGTFLELSQRRPEINDTV